MWNFSKYFFPYFFLLSGLILVIAAMADQGYMPESLNCQVWREANHEYSKIRDLSGDTDPQYPDLSLSKFSSACGLWKTWFSFAIITVFLYAIVLLWPMTFTVGRKFMFISLNTIVISAVLSSLFTFIFVIVFYAVAGAWKYDWKCQPGNPPTCAFFSGGVPFPTSPNPDILPWRNASEPFRNIIADPKFFARYALILYGTAATVMTCVGTFFGALGAIFLLILETQKQHAWEKSSTRAGTPASGGSDPHAQSQMHQAQQPQQIQSQQAIRQRHSSQLPQPVQISRSGVETGGQEQPVVYRPVTIQPQTVQGSV